MQEARPREMEKAKAITRTGQRGRNETTVKQQGQDARTSKVGQKR